MRTTQNYMILTHSLWLEYYWKLTRYYLTGFLQSAYEYGTFPDWGTNPYEHKLLYVGALLGEIGLCFLGTKLLVITRISLISAKMERYETQEISSSIPILHEIGGSSLPLAQINILF